MAARFAVALCPGCREPWAVELRHATATCPRCKSKVDLAARKPLWTGDDAAQAQAAVAEASARRKGGAGTALPPSPLPRHDSPADAAAAAAKGIINKSARAEEVARWLERVGGPMAHRTLVDALQRAGLDQDRAEAEITRMLAMDLLMEPKSATYRMVA